MLAARCATFVALVAPIPAHAQQFVLVDQTYTANKDNTEDSHFTAELEPGIPADFRSPTNYAEGSVHVDLEILEAPSTMMTKYNICLENSSNYACLPYVMYAGKGTQTADPKLMSIWQYDKVDWSKGVTKVSLILKDNAEEKVQGNADYYPYKAHVTLTVVAKGSTFDPDKGTTDMGGSAGRPGMQGSGGRGGATAGQAGSSGSGGKSSTQAGSGGGATNNGGSSANSATAGKTGAAGGAGASAAASGSAGVKAVQPPPTTTVTAGTGTPTSGAALSGVDAGSDDRHSITSQLENTSGCSVGALGGVRASAMWPWLALSVLALRRRKRSN
ncbi:MAG TPA: hypothetical protein VFN67_39855 [Polyangiales bacterium]|nr:hypothetical protein [Polyangiales bacterium]